MRIGELARLSRTPTRSLRYYEEQGLIHPRRLDNGYRDYGPDLVDRAVQIRHLIDCGIPTRIIAVILPCLDRATEIVPDNTSPELLDLLRTERGRMTERIDALTENRDAIDRYIDRADEALSRQLAGEAPATSQPT